MGRQFSTRYKEHLADFRHNNGKSNFAKHLNEESHPFGPMEEITQIMQYQKKGVHLNTIERYHIYTEFTADNHLNPLAYQFFKHGAPINTNFVHLYFIYAN